MKTAIKNLCLATLTVLALGTSAFAASTEQEKNITILNHVQHMQKIVANGNVEVILVQSATESVKVYDNYYAKNALVQEENGVLRISSFGKETLTVAVYVNNLSEIEANGNAKISTAGKVSFLSLNVRLNGHASANINANTLTLYTLVADQASLKLAGSTTDHIAVLGAQGCVNMDQFTADNSSISASSPILAKAVPEPVVAALPTDVEDFVAIGK
ncbi:MAG: DUF2807 domain-containing protein [Pedobacter sp.]|nr:DUF2807 domain-containing protein [Pedobacter sp.]MDQ8053201.1 DUF2807 domain-containing protein [Pedobacter sp.]